MNSTRFRLSLKLACAPLLLWGFAVPVHAQIPTPAAFVPQDVEICPVTADVGDPEFEPGGNRMVFTDSLGRLRVATMRADGTVIAPGCQATVIDTSVIIQMPDQTFRQGAEWGRSQRGSEIFYMKKMTDGSTSMWRASLNGNVWQPEMLQDGGSRGYPMPSSDATDPQPRVKYLRRLSTGKHIPMWRESTDPSTETAWPGLANPDTGGVPRWVSGRRAITTAWVDGNGYRQAAQFWIDTKTLEVMTSDPANHDEIWLWSAPEFGGEYIMATIVDGCCLKIYRQLGGTWTVVNTLDSRVFANQPLLFSPEPFVYHGRSYVALQIGTAKASNSSIWVVSIDPAQPLFRQVSDPAKAAIRFEPEWYVTSDGAMVYYSQYANGVFTTLRRAATGLP